jgi:hypothetical protein
VCPDWDARCLLGDAGANPAESKFARSAAAPDTGMQRMPVTAAR